MLSSYLIQPSGAIRQFIHQIPEEGGVYAMLLDHPEALQPALDRARLRLDPLRLGKRAILYLGATDDSLRCRLKCHLSNDTARSTFRQSLGAVLAEELKLEARPSGRRGFSFEPRSELILSDWINDHISIAVRSAPYALVEEKTLIALQDPLLNIAGRRGKASAETVLILRRRLRGLPFEQKALN
ncbi:hypothetical protein O3U67_15890 [Brevundimonas diminuta]|uniref:GIY-YIG nuclease family protein n=1 Tax=Brevundimonas diminuta TaxID=293 RepID=UPI0022AE5662|nr:hypothetical protein [Brevundimonas diminuta]MCZ4109572.1 hypothetical protein [Brevundimonas diminuta]